MVDSLRQWILYKIFNGFCRETAWEECLRMWTAVAIVQLMKNLPARAWVLLCGLYTAASVVEVQSQGVVTMNTIGPNFGLRFTNAMTRTWAEGDSYHVALYWGYRPDFVDRLVSGLATFGTGSLAGYVTTSTGGGNRTITDWGVPVTGDTYFQLRVWTGNYSSWEAAIASGDPSVLTSGLSSWCSCSPPIVMVRPSQGPTSPPAQIPWGGSPSAPILVALFSIPEPSVAGLAGLGLFGWLMIRRRK
jgi:hypothetical protein